MNEGSVSPESAAGVIAGMIQGRNHFHKAWESLEESAVLELVTGWSQAIREGREKGVLKVLSDIQDTEILKAAWDRIEGKTRLSMVVVIETVIEAVRLE